MSVRVRRADPVRRPELRDSALDSFLQAPGVQCTRREPFRPAPAELQDDPALRQAVPGPALARALDLARDRVDQAAHRACFQGRESLQAEHRGQQLGPVSDAAASATRRAKKAR